MSCRGHKVIIKMFPHAASDLEPAVKLLDDLGTKANLLTLTSSYISLCCK